MRNLCTLGGVAFRLSEVVMVTYVLMLLWLLRASLHCIKSPPFLGAAYMQDTRYKIQDTCKIDKCRDVFDLTCFLS